MREFSSRLRAMSSKVEGVYPVTCGIRLGEGEERGDEGGVRPHLRRVGGQRRGLWQVEGEPGRCGGRRQGYNQRRVPEGGRGYLNLCRGVPRSPGDSHVPRVEPGWGGGNRFFLHAA
jgi:hypothetical protein